MHNGQRFLQFAYVRVQWHKCVIACVFVCVVRVMCFMLTVYLGMAEGFVWLDRSAVEFTSWADSQPSGTGREGVPEHCVAMDSQTLTWDDKDCAAHLGYICSKLQGEAFVTKL